VNLFDIAAQLESISRDLRDHVYEALRAQRDNPGAKNLERELQKATRAVEKALHVLREINVAES
jgi:hypothetical protein